MIAALDGVVRRFGQRVAVDGVSLTVAKGEIFGLVGPDGAGKTTTIRMMIGIMAPDAGTVTILGSQRLEAVKEHIGYVPQRFSLYGDLTVMENIRLLGTLYGASGAKVDELAERILTFTNLIRFQGRLADQLSGGMKQKLALAAGLMHTPKILFLDEPTTGVDPVSRREFWQMLYRLNKEGMTVVVSTPYMDEAELCHRIAFMHDGRVVSCASPQALREQYPYRVLELHASDRDVRRHLEGGTLRDINAFGEKHHLIVDDPDTAALFVRRRLEEDGVSVYALREIPPTLEDVFVALAGEEV